jgi:hypothetical protein
VKRDPLRAAVPHLKTENPIRFNSPSFPRIKQTSYPKISEMVPTLKVKKRAINVYLLNQVKMKTNILLKKRTLLYAMLFAISSSAFISSCKKEKDNELAHTPPSRITTSTITEINATTATSGGTVSSEIGSEIVTRGICWSTLKAPTILNESTIDGAGAGTFVSKMTGLETHTQYYVRAYAIDNNSNVKYGNQCFFTTLATPAPENSFSASVNGSPYVARFISFTSARGITGISGKIEERSITINMPDHFTIGQHTMLPSGDYSAQYVLGSSTIYNVESGILNITEYDTKTGKISGTFNFTGTTTGAAIRTINITDGQFIVYK